SAIKIAGPAKYKVGHSVRVSKYKTVFEKGFYFRSYLGTSLLACSEVGCRGRPEFLIAEIRCEFSSNLLLSVVYRPPKIFTEILCIIDDSMKLMSFSQHGKAFLSARDLISIRYKIKMQRRSDCLVMCRNFKYFKKRSFF
ncbi:hypothetical protein ALC57_04016, partial [Trachymyrmex cornetzi]